jgi:hypothetical protein
MSFAADAHLAEKKTVCHETTVNKEKSLKFQVGTRTPTSSSKE